jgi:hypothetical protein
MIEIDKWIAFVFFLSAVVVCLVISSIETSYDVRDLKDRVRRIENQIDSRGLR